MRRFHAFAPFVALLVGLFAACGGRVTDDLPVSPEVEPSDAGRGPVTRPQPPVVDSGRDVSTEDGWGKVPDRPTSKPVVVDLGTVTARVDVPFDIPAGTLGFNVGITTSVSSMSLAVVDIRSPASAFPLAGSILFNGDHASTTTIFGDVAAAGVPGSNHPDTMPGVQPGTWKASFAGGSGDAKVRIQTTPDGLFHGGYVDLHVYTIAGARDLLVVALRHDLAVDRQALRHGGRPRATRLTRGSRRAPPSSSCSRGSADIRPTPWLDAFGAAMRALYERVEARGVELRRDIARAIADWLVPAAGTSSW